MPRPRILQFQDRLRYSCSLAALDSYFYEILNGSYFKNTWSSLHSPSPPSPPFLNINVSKSLNSPASRRWVLFHIRRFSFFCSLPSSRIISSFEIKMKVNSTPAMFLWRSKCYFIFFLVKLLLLQKSTDTYYQRFHRFIQLHLESSIPSTNRHSGQQQSTLL